MAGALAPAQGAARATTRDNNAPASNQLPVVPEKQKPPSSGGLFVVPAAAYFPTWLPGQYRQR
jgi:hypothetical protein